MKNKIYFFIAAVILFFVLNYFVAASNVKNNEWSNWDIFFCLFLDYFTLVSFAFLFFHKRGIREEN